MFKKISLSLCILAICSAATAQEKVADKIIAVVGNRAILQSEYQINLLQAKKGGVELNDSVRCDVFRNMVGEKILAEEAGRDSALLAKVTDEAVDADLQRKISYYAQNEFNGSVERMEAYLGKTVYQMKEESRESVRDNLLATEMQAELIQNVKVTPNEVQQFFTAIPEDELPFFPASVEVGQIVVQPDVSPEVEKYTMGKLEDIRRQIVEDGKDFGMMAGMYSQDDTKDNGGELTIDRKGFDPVFVSAAYKLQPGEISPVIKTDFGYHIIQMVKRLGDQAVVRHIILIPDITSVDLQKTLDKLDTMRQELLDKKITFQEAVGKYSNDKNAKMTGGMVYDQQTSSSILSLDNLPDPQMALAIAKLQVGDYSTPETFTDPYTRRKSCRILYLRSRTDPHKANLADDYNRIQTVALQKKQNEYLTKWMIEKIPTHYLKMDPKFADCPDLTDWYRLSAKQ